jgi:hypothetical protein
MTLIRRATDDNPTQTLDKVPNGEPAFLSSVRLPLTLLREPVGDCYSQKAAKDGDHCRDKRRIHCHVISGILTVE